MLKITAFLRALLAKPQAPDWSFGLIKELGIGQMLADQQWLLFERTVAELSPENLTRLLDGLCLTKQYAQALQQYQQTGAADLRELMAGAHALFLAWEARSMQAASAVSDQQFAGFYQHLENSFQHFNKPFKSKAVEAESLARLVRVAMGLSDLPMAQSAFQACLTLAPTHLLAHLNYFKVLSPKWLGSEDALVQFVDNVPAPALRKLLQAMYLVEVYSDLYYENYLQASALFRERYLARAEQVVSQQEALPDNSLFAIYHNNYFACLHHLLGHATVRRQFLQAVPNSITFYPWAYFGYQDARAVHNIH